MVPTRGQMSFIIFISITHDISYDLQKILKETISMNYISSIKINASRFLITKPTVLEFLLGYTVNIISRPFTKIPVIS